MHKKYAKQGLVALSLNCDLLKRPLDGKDISAEARANALKFLNEMNATFTNLQLDEPDTVWKEKFRVISFPVLYVFDRQGKWYRFDGDKSDEGTVDHAKVEALVKKLLAEK